MAAADVVVNPSYTEGLPTSVLEAAMMGKAVLATDVGGTPEIVADGEEGVLVGAHDVEALRSGLERLIADPDLRRLLGAAAHASAAGRFDWEASAAAFAAIANALASGPSGPAAQDAGTEGESRTSLNADS